MNVFKIISLILNVYIPQSCIICVARKHSASSLGFDILYGDTVAAKKVNDNNEDQMIQTLTSYHTICVG
ncbi:hypothetical protein Y032_0060g3178 [Ancylostoma ceylanicum]|uniref:Uncharacterized protein n=1 Tax=Ancylostoma ceylanicum TaxID=53326 RepID=A0A016U416_9BILA|nr:hypothetical protein Y032_0060g3178 [Ancylostoma ceylanicum]